MPKAKADLLVSCGVTNVTVTLNAVDVSIGSKIYLMAHLGGARLKAKQAADVIIRNQLDGLSVVTEKGILVKVNTVLIPGINDTHLPEIAAAAKQRGAFMMNIIPLIPAGRLRHIRAPEQAMLSAARRACSFFVPQMRHCRRCRADSVGLLDQTPRFKKDNLLPEKETKNIRVAVASKGNGMINQHFGHARGFYIYEIGVDGVHLHEFRKIRPYCVGPETCAQDGADALFALGQLSDCEALIWARIGQYPRQTIEQAGLKVIETLNSIESELQRLRDKFGVISKNSNVGRSMQPEVINTESSKFFADEDFKG
jgi:nitrogen fixation protein NifB